MIETEVSIVIDADMIRVWDYAQDIRQWANLFPGCRECEVINEHDSRWVLKVGAGGLVRTVNVLVHVDDWRAPDQVNFSYRLEGDPVQGGGSYIAVRKSAEATEVTLTIRVAGTGPIAPLWEAMSRPLLPKLARSFAERLKSAIEDAVAVRQGPPPPVSPSRI